MPETIYVECPCCGERIEIDKKSGKIIKHFTKPEVKDGVDPMQAALEKIKQDKNRLNDYFLSAGQTLKDKEKKLAEQFENEKKRIQESGDNSRPVNPMDLD